MAIDKPMGVLQKIRQHRATQVCFKTSILLSFFLATGSATCANQKNEIAQSATIDQQHLEEVVSRLVGTMETSAQAIANPNAPDVRLTTCQVSVENTNSQPNSQPNSATYLYQEQAMRSRPEQPYRQRFLRIALSEDGTSIESAGFQPADLETWAGFCSKPDAERIIQLSDLGEFRCSVFLKPAEDDYIGETPESGCPTSYRGAVRITNTVVLHSAGMDTWDRGFDEAGNQLWGADNEPYQFRRVNP